MGNLTAAVDLVATVVGVPVAALRATVPQPKTKPGAKPRRAPRATKQVWQVELVDPGLLAGLPGPSSPVRSPQVLASGSGKWRTTLRMDTWVPPELWAAMSRAEQRRVGRSHVHFQLGESTQLRLPVQLHRPLPADADVPEAKLTRTRVAGQHQLTLACAVKVPDPAPVQGRAAVALHLGWRQREDGSLRVATWASPQVLTVPAVVADVVVSHGGHWGEVVIPAEWLTLAERPPLLASDRAKAMAPHLEALAAWLEEHPEACTPRMTPNLVRLWKAAGRLAALTLRWRDQKAPDGSDALVAQLEAWRHADRARWEQETHIRRRVCARRDDAWNRVAHWLAGQAGTIVVDDIDLTKVRLRTDAAETDPTLPEGVAQAARARAGLAAPGLLRQRCTVTAQRDGLTVATVPAGPYPHRPCGTQAPAALLASAAVIRCPGCGNGYDQDYNAAMIMLERQQS